MSDNTSSTGGFLVPVTLSPENDDLANALQTIAVGITGLDPTLVRPRWQPQPPTQPPVTIDWCAIGITSYEAVDYPQVYLDPQDGTSSEMFRLERVNVLATFYGPHAASLASQLRDGLYLEQNCEAFVATGLKVRSADDMVMVPELINSQFVYRSDLHCSFMRMVNRTYPIQSILSAKKAIYTDSGLSCIETISQGDH